MTLESIVEFFAFITILIALASLGLWVVIAARAARKQPIIALRRRRAVPWGFEGLFVAVGLLILITVGLAHYARSAGWITELDGGELSVESLASRSNLILVEGVGRTLACALLVVWLISLYRASTKDLGVKLDWGNIHAGLVAVVAMLPPIFMLQAALNAWWIEYEHPVLKVLEESGDLSFFIPMVAVAVFVAPVTEEFLFRVVLQGWLESVAMRDHEASATDCDGPSCETMSVPYWPIVVSSLFFALMHMGQGPAPVTLFFLALGLGYLYRQTHSIWPSLIVHFSLNAFTMTGLAIAIQSGRDLSV